MRPRTPLLEPGRGVRHRGEQADGIDGRRELARPCRDNAGTSRDGQVPRPARRPTACQAPDPARSRRRPHKSITSAPLLRARRGSGSGRCALWSSRFRAECCSSSLISTAVRPYTDARTTARRCSSGSARSAVTARDTSLLRSASSSGPAPLSTRRRSTTSTTSAGRTRSTRSASMARLRVMAMSHVATEPRRAS